MSDRERWIVYPLLFLALLQSQRDAYLASYGTAQFSSIQCNSIDVQSPAGESKVRIVGNPSTGLINVYGNGPQRCVALSTKNGGNAGHLELIHSVKYSGVTLTAHPDGGTAEFTGAPTAPAIRLGVDPKTKKVSVGPANGHLIPIEIELSESGLQFISTVPGKENDPIPNQNVATDTDDEPADDKSAEDKSSDDKSAQEQRSDEESTEDESSDDNHSEGDNPDGEPE